MARCSEIAEVFVAAITAGWHTGRAGPPFVPETCRQVHKYPPFPASPALATPAEAVWLAVQQVAGKVLAECGGEGKAHWLDDGSEHPHRIALSMQAACVPSATASLQRGCDAVGLQVGHPPPPAASVACAMSPCPACYSPPGCCILVLHLAPLQLPAC